MITEVLVWIGVGCIIVAPLCVVLSFIVLRQLGRNVAAKRPNLWDEMKPGLYADINISRDHRRRLSEFLSNHEYLTLNDPLVTRFAVSYRALQFTAVVTAVAAVVTILISFKYG